VASLKPAQEASQRLQDEGWPRVAWFVRGSGRCAGFESGQTRQPVSVRPCVHVCVRACVRDLQALNAQGLQTLNAQGLSVRHAVGRLSEAPVLTPLTLLGDFVRRVGRPPTSTQLATYLQRLREQGFDVSETVRKVQACGCILEREVGADLTHVQSGLHYSGSGMQVLSGASGLKRRL
jgi:hypothetical protein